MLMEIPDWSIIGKTIEWYNPHLVVFANDDPWFKEKNIAFGIDGFFHQWEDYPIYFSKYAEYGKTIREPILNNDSKVN